MDQHSSKESRSAIPTTGACHALIPVQAKFADVATVQASISNHFNQDRGFSVQTSSRQTAPPLSLSGAAFALGWGQRHRPR